MDDYNGEIKLRNNTVSDKMYPAQMLEVAGDLLRTLANFENPELVHAGCTPLVRYDRSVFLAGFI